MAVKKFTVVIEKDEDNYFVGSVVELPGCYTQAKSMDKLIKRIKEAIKLYLEVKKEAIKEISLDFVGIQAVEVRI